ncbi:hypothetical protein DFJ58DRAFT_912346 [Suillus subalutaceus]|uniref:uncharacterized protein n=1 Tax=Suillus subalutaceus TaxID=48586 RepID=UPI001B8664F0|nr:uncharacterized protein DFJ58DRAFT_912346 [Suillus subalutaceus]KAG1863577.1 hypothetical protein DFJ58DRAFT_912346 [Suillus subalutaceus]
MLLDLSGLIIYDTLNWMGEVVNVILGVIMIARLHAMYQRSRKVSHASFLVISCLQIGFFFSTLSADIYSLDPQIYLGLAEIFQVVQMFVLGPRLILGVGEYHAELVANSNTATAMTSIAFQERVHQTVHVSNSSRSGKMHIYCEVVHSKRLATSGTRTTDMDEGDADGSNKASAYYRDSCNIFTMPASKLIALAKTRRLGGLLRPCKGVTVSQVLVSACCTCKRREVSERLWELREALAGQPVICSGLQARNALSVTRIYWYT